MKKFTFALMFAAIFSAISVGVMPSVRADAAACGEKGQPSCPLQGWMEKNLDGAMDKKDMKALEAGLTKVPTFVPDPKWNDGDKGWSKIAKDGAAAAKAGNLEAVQQACKTCHKTWRSQYKKDFRLRPISG
jgi:hypothetical protein